VSLERYGSCTLADDGCVTCGDNAVPVRVLETSGGEAEVEDRVGGRARVALDFVPEAQPGDLVLVHLGVAIALLGDEHEGARAKDPGLRPRFDRAPEGKAAPGGRELRGE
jgi:hydrogenase expression/formation protein HypC